MSPQYGELRHTSGWDRFTSLGYPCKFQLVSSLGSITARHLVVGVSQTLRRWTEGATYIRPSRWALAHISSLCMKYIGNRWTEATECRLAAGGVSAHGTLIKDLRFAHEADLIAEKDTKLQQGQHQLTGQRARHQFQAGLRGDVGP